MESLGIIVLGYGTADFPSFWLRSSGHPLDWSVPDAPAVAAIMESREELEVCSAIVVANPLTIDEQLDPTQHDVVLEEALRRVEEKGIVGKDVTPFLLESIVELTGGESLEVNLRIAENNIRLAAEIATAWSAIVSRVLVVGDLVDDISVRVLDDVTEASDTNAEIRLRPGGSAGNVAAWLGHLGVDAIFCGRVGADAVDRHTRALAEHGVEANVAGDPGTTATIVLQLDREGERTMFVDRGANRGLVPRTCRPRRGTTSPGCTSPGTPSSTPPPGRWRWSCWPRRVGAVLGSASTRVRWRSCAPPAVAVFLGWIDGADVIFPNLDEARVLVGSTGPQIDLEALAARFPHVVVTLGSMGAAYLSGTERTQITAPRIDVIDTTGAGDAFAAGFLARWIEGATPEEALEGGRAAAEKCVAHLGARPT